MSSDRVSTSSEFAKLLDSKFTIPGTNIRFGIDPIIGLIPGAGDWLGGVFSIYFMFQAVRAGGSSPVLTRMFINILLDIVIGSIPVLGEIFDVAWKANLKNARLLDELARDPQKTQQQSRWFNWIMLAVFIVLILGLLLLVSWMIIELVEFLF